MTYTVIAYTKDGRQLGPDDEFTEWPALSSFLTMIYEKRKAEQNKAEQNKIDNS